MIFVIYMTICNCNTNDKFILINLTIRDIGIKKIFTI